MDFVALHLLSELMPCALCPHVPLRSEENIHSLFTGQKMTLNFQLEQKGLSMRFPHVLWSSKDHFGLTWEQGFLLKMVSVLMSGSCMSNIVL